MSTNLKRLRDSARQDLSLVFTSMYHHITDVDNLRRSYLKLAGNKANGIDGVTKKEYGENLEVNLKDLSVWLKLTTNTLHLAYF